MAMDLRTRHRVPERMDDPALDEAAQVSALRGLQRINWLSRSAAIVWPPIRDLARTMPVGARPLRVLDIATGAGDVPIGLWRRAVRAGWPMEMAGCDLSPGAVRHARQQATRASAPVHFFQLDALRQELPRGYDVLICSLFLHHLDNGEAAELLGKLSVAARHLVLVNDLRRDGLGWLLAWSCPRLLTASPVVHSDAVLSVRAAFTLAEMRELAVRAGLAGATIGPRWPRRFLLCWRKRDLGESAPA